MTKNTEKPRTPLVNLYAVRDVVAAVFLTPFTSQNNQTAERMFRNMIQSEGNSLNQNPQDFDLYLVGDFDPVDGQIDNFDHNLLLIKGETVGYSADHARQSVMHEKEKHGFMQNMRTENNDDVVLPLKKT